jgi:adenylate cyclase
VVDAVRCAAEIQRGMIDREPEVPEGRRIRFRIGINLGDVIAEEQDIFGDGVNVAARLEALAEPGGICVSRVVRDQVRDKVDFGFQDLGEQHVKNITRPVRVYRVRDRLVANEQPSSASSQPLPLPDKPSIAVLPFANMSSDPEHEYFADGMVEEIITALSRYPSLVVIARNSSFTYKARAVDVKQVGRELGVRYVLEGGLRKAGDRIRVTAQLVEAETGTHLWAKRYDSDLADIFALQDEITKAVTIAVAPAVADAELRRAMRKPPGSLDAWAAYQRGLWHVFKVSRDDDALAQKYFQQAIDLDPAFAGGYKGLAVAYMQAATLLQTRRQAEAYRSAEALVRRAIALDSADAEAHATLAAAMLRHGDYEGALAEAEIAVAMSPNLALAHGTLGEILIFSGRPKEGIAAVQTSIRLDPNDPKSANRLNNLASGLYLCGEYETAVAAAKRAVRANPDFPLAYRWLAAALGQLGRTAEAKKAPEKAITVAPATFDMYVSQRVLWHRPEDHAHMLDGLRKAGWRET